ncbi:RNA-directed DNA polymerase from transposon BS [Paramuricea clavata]|uniref:RNA-directed DNA polymerase from transposon BS n=1 Tax=Paramuricea clavata TaxID=317549 RepID=A0A7D9D9I5_PARCT|nr:RNA-directed DNA polymerase from transposon BS [Paramuricea clavata]
MALKSDVHKLECLLSETSSKLVAAESEKASLVTVIRLMNEDCANAVKDVGDNVRSQTTQPRNPWCTVHTRSENLKGNEVSRLHNQFSSLEDEANELNNNSDFDASVINIDSDIQQPTPSQNMSESTSKFTEPKDDRTQGTSGNSDRVPKKGIALIGDSIIKNVSPVKLSKRKVYKFTYPGETTIEITNELAKINIKPDPSHVVIHAGTNDVPVESIDECVGNMEKLITTAKQKFPNSKIGISGLTLRQDSDLISKIEEINEKGWTILKFTAPTKTFPSGFSKEHNKPSGRTTKCDNELEQVNCQDVPSNSLLGIDSEINIIAKSKGLKIANLNVNSLMKHLDEIRLILNNNALDILAINESKIDNQISNNEIHIDGFNIICKDRNRFGGGVVLYVRQNISFSDRIDLIPDELEMVCTELSLPYNKSLLISTWYRPPNSLMNIFDYRASFLAKCDNEDKELILIGDLNCDVSKTIPYPQTCKLQFLCSLYQIDQLIKESTRLTPKSATLIDLILTNRPENISRSAVIHLGISDHSLVYAVRKFTLPKGRQKIRQVRNFKNFVENDFIRDVSQLPWEMVYQFGDPNLCWQVWKSLLLDALNRHAPLRHKRIRNNPVPWINPQIKELMRKRDYHKKKAIKYDSESQWELYKTLRNEVNINMRKAKSKYFCDKIQASSQMGDSKSGWAWINSLLGRKHKNENINELKVNDDIISDDKSITETLNEYFINIGMKMAAESACQSTDALNDQVIYESTVLLPKENFHFADITIDSVSKRLQKLNVSKATGIESKCVLLIIKLLLQEQ